MPLKVQEKDFWEEFLKKNLAFRTEIFGGNNPLFVPYLTDEKDYEDRYIHNVELILNPLSKEEILGTDKKRQPLLDVDYVRNTMMLDMPSGYGAFESQQEVEAELERLESVAGDLQSLGKKEKSERVNAKKIINKYNGTSQRIIESNHVTRTFNLLGEEAMIRETEDTGV